MPDGEQESRKSSCGLFLQMQIASSADLLWGHNTFQKKSLVSSDYFPVERLITKRTSHGTTLDNFIKWTLISSLTA